MTLYAIARPTCRCRRELSGNHVPLRGLNSWMGVSSRPSLPLCHGKSAPASPAARAAAWASPSRRYRYCWLMPAKLRLAEREQRMDEDFVPEDVTAVTLTGQAAGGDPGVDICTQCGSLEDVEGVQVQRGPRPFPCLYGDAELSPEV